MVETLYPLAYGRVTGRFLAAVGDSTDDTDVLPDAVPVSGTVTFTPSAAALLVPSATPDPATVLPVPVTCTLDDQGYLSRNGVRGVWLMATNDVSVNPTGYTYTVSFTGLNAAGQSVKYSDFSISVLSATTQDLSVLAPVTASNGVTITRGEKGDAGAGLNLVGQVANVTLLPTNLTATDANKSWVSADNGHLYIWTGQAFSDAGQFVGPPITLDVGTVTSGSTPSATVTGSAVSKVLNLVLPQGAPGPAGATGPQGDPGPTGPVGPQGASSAALTKTRNGLTGWYHFDAWAADDQGVTDCTAALQDAVTTMLADGGGTLYMGASARYRVAGTVYVNKPDQSTPFRLLGEPTGSDSFIPTNEGVTLYKDTAGDMFRLNLNSDLSPFATWYTYDFESSVENINFEGTETAETYVFRTYRTRFRARRINVSTLDGFMMQDRNAPSTWTDNYSNYGDQSFYEDITFYRSKTCAMSLTGSDNTVLNRITLGYSSAGAQYGIRIYYGTTVTISGLLYSDGSHLASSTLKSVVEVTGGSGLTINGLHIEECDAQAFFDINNSFGVSITGVHERFRGRTFLKLTGSAGVSLNGWNVWATRDAGYYDIDASAGCADITYRGAWVTTYNSGDPTLLRPVLVRDPDGAVGRVTNNAASPINWETGTTYTLQYTDIDKYIENGTGSLLVTVPLNSAVPFPLGTKIKFRQYSPGAITLTSGAALRSSKGVGTRAQWSVMTIEKRATDEWFVSGDTA